MVFRLRCMMFSFSSRNYVLRLVYLFENALLRLHFPPTLTQRKPNKTKTVFFQSERQFAEFQRTSATKAIKLCVFKEN